MSLIKLPEPIFYPIPSRFVEIRDDRETDFLVSLCGLLALHKVDRSDIDSMKEAINLYIVNQVEDWMKIQDKERLKDTVRTNYKAICGAGAFIRNRKETRQTEWETVLQNHIKILAAYSHILSLN